MPGADSIEHGNEVTDEQLKQMRDKGIFFDLTPTFLWRLFYQDLPGNHCGVFNDAS